VLLALAVIGANMQCKLPVALRLEVAHHFIEGFASGRTRSVEDPDTFGATKTPKSLLFNPYQLPTHGPPCRCAPTSAGLPSRDETFYCLIAAENRHPVWAWRKMSEKGWAKFTCASLDGLSGSLHIHGKVCSRERLISGTSFEVSGIALGVGHVACVLKRSVLLSSRIVSSIV
jgi:hypothetical protein